LLRRSSVNTDSFVGRTGYGGGKEKPDIGTGTFTNPALVAGLRANPDGYYVNVHTTVCPNGVARGQLGDHGPGNN
jgi:hypothetical protein